ncbi:ACT domain protein [uncultured archaeon]|nr:ACT domain protein [uncultured archaeon]
MKQLTVVSEDKVGLLSDITFILGKAKINIEALQVEVRGKTAIIHMTLKDVAKASRLLEQNGYKLLESEIILVSVKDEPAQTAEMTALLSKEKISITNAYVVASGDGMCTMALKVDKPSKAKKVLAAYIAEE